jgi:hypothetical protein
MSNSKKILLDTFESYMALYNDAIDIYMFTN